MRRAALVVLVLLGATMAGAQDKAGTQTSTKPDAVPVLTEIEALTLDRVMLLHENAQLRLVNAQREYDRARELASALAAKYQRPGYTLTRDPQSGAWAYVRESPKK